MHRSRRTRKKAGGASWLATYSDLMNLLLCFFVMLYAMSSINAGKYEEIKSSFANVGIFGSGILPGKEGALDGENGILEGNDLGKEESDSTVVRAENAETELNDEQVKEAYLAGQRQATEKLFAELDGQAVQSGLKGNGVAVLADYDYNCVIINIDGAVLFESGETEIRSEALPLMSKIGDILQTYEGGNMIEIVGHTDNVPVSANARYRDNNELSTDRALSAFYYFVQEKGISPAEIKYSGRGEYEPVATNETEEGRQKNRRIEIQIYPSL